MSLSEKLNKYKVDKGYTKGVVINLDDAPDVDFLVKLPGPYNRPYMADVYGSIQLDMASEDMPSPKMSVMQARDVQEAAFLEHCLVSIDGEDVPENFATEFPEAVEELMKKAGELVQQVSNRVEDGIKKSLPTSTGSAGGATG